MRTRNNLLVLALLVFAVSGLAGRTSLWAYPVQIEILPEEKIRELPEKALEKAYIDAVVEIQAMRAFHETSGFMPKDYQGFKDLLRYRILLLNEFYRRELEPPKTD